MSLSRLVNHNFTYKQYLINVPNLIQCRKDKRCDYCDEEILSKDMYYKYDLGFKQLFYFGLHRKCYMILIEKSQRMLRKEKRSILV